MVLVVVACSAVMFYEFQETIDACLVLLEVDWANTLLAPGDQGRGFNVSIKHRLDVEQSGQSGRHNVTLLGGVRQGH